MTQNRKLGWRRMNGFRRLNGLLMKGKDGIPLWKALGPNSFQREALGEDNWLDADLIGSLGVGDLTKISGIQNTEGGVCDDSICVLDDRHIPVELQHMLCDDTEMGETFRDIFDALLGMAWPANAQLWLCCSASGTACEDPEYVFAPPEGPPMAPHFLTTKFESGQQEALTAGLIAKINTHGTILRMDVAGRFDLGAAGALTLTREEPNRFHHYLGNAWGNMFLDCNVVATDPLCAAAAEEDRLIGRNESYHGLPMFSCSGESDYPIKASGKSCFSEDMASNDAGDCSYVAAAGVCDVVCVGGMCGVNQPFVEGRGSTNVLYVYMDEYDIEGSRSVGQILAIGIPLLVAFVLAIGLGKLYSSKRRQHSQRASAFPTPPFDGKDATSVQDAETDGSVEDSA